MVLAHAARQRAAGVTQVHAWARALAVDLESHPDLCHALERALHKAPAAEDGGVGEGAAAAV
jgi:hypothetical protein